MRAVSLHNKDEIEARLRHNPYLHLYALGDLDDFFWEYTTWYGLEHGGPPVLLYTGTAPPVLLALGDESFAQLRELLQLILPLLPRRFYAHLSGDLAEVLSEEYRINSHGTHHKMGLTNTDLLDDVDTSEVVQLEVSDVHDLEALYRKSYPDNWFDPRMLETNHYYGIRRGGELVSVTGVHVYSPSYKVAALGNVTTHPDWRGQRLGTRVSAALCRALLRTVNHIGLNVKADNTSAITCYKGLGFEKVASYEECAVEVKS